MNEKTFLAREKSLALKGIFALFVLMHHLYQYSAIITGTAFGNVFQAMGYLSVAVFFFLSGYGLSKSAKMTEGYLKSFPRNRLLTFYIEIIVFLIIYLILNAFKSPDAITWKSVLKSLTFGGTLIANGWYLQVALVLYIIFYFIYRFIKHDRCKPWIMLGFTILLIVILYIARFSNTWYEGLLAFPLGLLLVEYEEKLYTANLKINILTSIVSLALFCVSFLGSGLIKIGIISLILKMFSALFFVAFVVFIIRYIPIACKPTLYLGKISLEIYALQGLLIWILRIDAIANLKPVFRLLISIGIFLSVIGISALAHPVTKRINQLVSGKSSAKSQNNNQTTRN